MTLAQDGKRTCQNGIEAAARGNSKDQLEFERRFDVIDVIVSKIKGRLRTGAPATVTTSSSHPSYETLINDIDGALSQQLVTSMSSLSVPFIFPEWGKYDAFM